MTRRIALLILVAVALPVAVFPQRPSTGARPLVVQGAMKSETEKLASQLDNVTVEHVGGWTFWRGTVKGYPVIVSRTLKGGANAAAATAIVIERYNPIAIINQGTAGGHEPGLHLYDIVLGVRAVSLGAFKSPFRKAGAGSNTLDWIPLNLTASDGSAGNDPNARNVAQFSGDTLLLGIARRVTWRPERGRVVEGVIGSSDVWNDEIDRIDWFHTRYGTSVEEMETASAAQIADLFHVPFLGIRIVSDNTTNGDAYDPKTGESCQDYVYQVVRAYIATATR
jgi:adenosylhomocysteine nucleosidase